MQGKYATSSGEIMIDWCKINMQLETFCVKHTFAMDFLCIKVVNQLMWYLNMQKHDTRFGITKQNTIISRTNCNTYCLKHK